MIWIIVAAVAGFIFGVLFGRQNKNKIEKALAEAKEQIKKLSGGKLDI